MRINPRVQSDLRTPLAVIGAAAAAFVGAKLLRSALLWAQTTLSPPNINKFKGEWALVTGGSEGIGKSVAAELASAGLHVVLVSRSQHKLDAAAEQIRLKNTAVQVMTYVADLTDTSSYSKLLQHLSDNNIHISVLMANAGGTPWPIYKPFWQYTDHETSVIATLNGNSCYDLVRGLVPAMVEARKGAVVCISSIVSGMPAYMAPYGAEKAKMNALCQALDIELHGTGVTAQAMLLGPVMTPAAVRLWQPQTPSQEPDTAQDTAVTAAVADTKPNLIQPSSETAAAAIVRCIGGRGPLVTPYWGHGLLESIFHCWWPPELHGSVLRSFARGMRVKFDKLHPQGAQNEAAKTASV